MPKEPSRLKVQADASTDEHYTAIRSLGQQYIYQACRQHLPAPARQRIVQAALKHLEVRSSQAVYSTSSQHPSQPIMSQGSATVTSTSSVRNAAFQSHLTTLIDAEIPAHALIDFCKKCADTQLLPVLSKCLCVLARLGHIRDLKTVAGNLVMSQSQYLDHELNPTPENSANRAPIQTIVSEDADADNTGATISVKRTGQNFVDEFVSSLVEGPSSTHPNQFKSNDVLNASVAREVPLSDHAKERVLHLLINRMRQIDIFELPGFIYQLLLFTSQKGKDSVTNRVILMIAEVFTHHEENARSSFESSQRILADDEDAIVANSISIQDLREVQGTALYHIDVAARQDPSLSAEVIRLTKNGVENPRHLLSPFGAGIVLLLARSNLLQNDVLSLLREAVARFDKERANRTDNVFIGIATKNDAILLDPRQSLFRIAESTCENGWDFVKEGLLDLSFVLLDKPLPLLRTTRRKSLAMDLISKLFQAHSVMRPTILQQLQSRVALQEKSAFHAIRIISTLSTSYPSILLEHQTFIRDCIELLAALPQWLAYPLMQCFKPFLELRQDLLDFFYLVVRKSLFYRESSTRAVAITGFLTLASIVKTPGSASRNMSQSMSQATQPQSGAASRVDIIIETVQPLRRVFSYPPALRAFFYKSIISVVQNTASASNCRHISEALGSVLLSHVRRFIEPERPPHLLLDLCVNESAGGVFQEPLGDLLWCLAVTESKRAPQKYHESHIIDLARKLSAVSLQDFPVSKAILTSEDDGADNLESSQSEQAVALANRNKVRVLGSVLEALIHATLIMPREQFNWRLVSDVVVPLLLLKGKVFELLRNAGLASPSDTFRDLGGDLELERLRPGARLAFQRISKGSGSGGKKSGGGKKGGKLGDQSVGAGSTQGVRNHRFGVFSVLTSAHMKPSLSLQAALDILQVMSEASGESQDDNNPFEGYANSQDFQELRVYLLSVAHKHLDDFVQSMSKWSVEDPEMRPVDVMGMVSAVEMLVKTAMNDFKRFRRASGDAAQGGLKALQIGESCAAALPLLCQTDDKVVTSFCKALLPDEASSVFDDEKGVCETAAMSLEKLVENLLSDSLNKEAMTVLRIHGHLVQCILLVLGNLEKKGRFLERRVNWAVGMIASKTIVDIPIVKTLTHSLLTYTENNDDVRRGEEISLRLLIVMGSCDNNAEPPEDMDTDGSLKTAVAVHKDTSLCVVDAVCDMIERGLNDVEWCLGRMVSLETTLDTQFSSDIVTEALAKQTVAHDKELHDKTAKASIRAEDAAQTRLTGVIQTLIGLLKCAIAKWVQQERLLKFVSRAYKLLSMATQAQLKRRGDVRTSFVKLVNESKLLSPALSRSYMFTDESNIVDEGKVNNAAKVKSEGRIKAQVVYDEERFHQQLIAASKKSKINLLRGMRRNAARDFRIMEHKLREEDEDHGGDGGEGDGERDDESEKRGRGGGKNSKWKRPRKS